MLSKTVAPKTPQDAQEKIQGGRQNLKGCSLMDWRFTKMALHHRTFHRKSQRFQDDPLKEQICEVSTRVSEF